MSKIGIMILGHGSSYEYNKNIMYMQKERLEEMGFENVYIGFNQMCRPYIEDSMKAMAEDGIDEVVAVPFFIASGLHMTHDIPPKLMLQEGENHKKVCVNGHEMTVHFEEPFGEDPNLAKILFDKFNSHRTEKNTAALVIGHGSKLPHNKHIITLNTQRLNDMGVKAYYAFNELNEPKIEDVLVQMVKDGADEIIAMPLFISKGDHLKNDLPGKLHLKDGINEGTFTENGRKILMKYTLPIGDDPRLTEVLAAKCRKYTEA